MIITDFTALIAERMCTEHRALAARWFERLLELLPVDARAVFPSESLLDHIPALILEISAYVREPAEDAIAANTSILEKARELGALRHGQRASLHQVLREYQILSGVLVTFVLEEMDRLDNIPPASESVSLVSRLNQAVNVLSQSTVETFVTLYMQTIAEQNERLEQFTRMIAHEWRQPLGALQFGVSLLRRPGLAPEHLDRTLAAVERNVRHLVELTHKLEAVARVHEGGDSAVVQEVSASTVAQEAARQLREMAEARAVDLRIADELPTLTVDVGRLELVFVNLLSNAIKYLRSGQGRTPRRRQRHERRRRVVPHRGARQRHRYPGTRARGHLPALHACAYRPRRSGRRPRRGPRSLDCRGLRARNGGTRRRPVRRGRGHGLRGDPSMRPRRGVTRSPHRMQLDSA